MTYIYVGYNGNADETLVGLQDGKLFLKKGSGRFVESEDFGSIVALDEYIAEENKYYHFEMIEDVDKIMSYLIPIFRRVVSDDYVLDYLEEYIMTKRDFEELYSYLPDGYDWDDIEAALDEFYVFDEGVIDG